MPWWEKKQQLYGRFKRLIKYISHQKPGPGKEKETVREKRNLS